LSATKGRLNEISSWSRSSIKIAQVAVLSNACCGVDSRRHRGVARDAVVVEVVGLAQVAVLSNA
jgi:hypothetical protein